MITFLEGRHFRKHEDLRINFTAGINLICGPNEIGKSTIYEMCLYALYGTRALRSPLTQVVSWGHKESELSVRLGLVASGREHTFKRSKSGAEVLLGDKVIVTGQAEVSKYAAELLGADEKMASMLVMASQSGLRGALDNGPSAVSALMGKLADFDLIDQIIERAAAQLTLGSDVALKTKLDQSHEALLEAEAAAPGEEEAAEAAEAATAMAKANAEADALAQQEGPLHVAYVDADADLQSAVETNRARAIARSKVAQLQQERGETRTAHELAVRKAQDRPTSEEIEAVERAAAAEKDYDNVVRAYRAFKQLPPFPKTFWEGDRASFNAELKRAKEEEKAHAFDLAAASSELKQHEASLLTGGKCPTCGTQTQDPAHLAQHNTHVRSLIELAADKVALLRGNLRGAKDAREQLELLLEVAHSRSEALHNIPSNLVIVTDVSVPQHVEWVGEPPADKPSAEAQTRLKDLQNKARAADQAAGRAEVLSARIADLERELSARPGPQEIADIDVEPLRTKMNSLWSAYKVCTDKQRDLRTEVQSHAACLKNYELLCEGSARQIKATSERLKELQGDLAALAFNNSLVKKLKGLKPAITDHLWNKVLAAVSNFFSAMRGTQSVVSKGVDGFEIDGQHVDNFSGSTLDVLAIAIRFALAKTFIPHLSMVMLDEPAHGCNRDRTSDVLGFLAGSGFEQVVLASHDELSESIADNVIALA